MKIVKKLLKYKFIRFAFVGGLGSVTNLLIFYILADVLSFNYILVSICAFIIAVTQNYFLNHRWTFRDITLKTKPSMKSYLKFILVSLGGLGVKLTVLILILRFFKLPLKVIAEGLGIIAGMMINYFGSKLYVFIKEGKNPGTDPIAR